MRVRLALGRLRVVRSAELSFSRVLGRREFGLEVELSGFRVDASGTVLLDGASSRVMGVLVVVVVVGVVVGVDDVVSVAEGVGPR